MWHVLVANVQNTLHVLKTTVDLILYAPGLCLGTENSEAGFLGNGDKRAHLEIFLL